MSSPSTAVFYLEGIEVKRLHCNAGWFGFRGDWFDLLDSMCKYGPGDDSPENPNNFEWDEVKAYGESELRRNIKAK